MHERTAITPRVLLIQSLTTHLATFTDVPRAGSSKIHTPPHKPQVVNTVYRDNDYLLREAYET